MGLESDISKTLLLTSDRSKNFAEHGDSDHRRDDSSASYSHYSSKIAEYSKYYAVVTYY